MVGPDWGKKLGLKNRAVTARIKQYGWSPEKAISTPKIVYLGYYKDKRGKYQVKVKRKGKEYYVGRFKTVQEAKEARDKFIGSFKSPKI